MVEPIHRRAEARAAVLGERASNTPRVSRATNAAGRAAMYTEGADTLWSASDDEERHLQRAGERWT